MNFLLTVCMAAIASALFRLLVPENKFSKQISLLIVCVFLLTGINALCGAQLDLSADVLDIGVTEDYIGFSGDVNKSLQKKICADMSEKLYTLMNENDIFPLQIHIGVNISGLYSISITQVKLVLRESDQDKADRALSLLKDALSDNIEIKLEYKQEG